MVVDLITGFLGAGKTTFIRTYAKYFMNKGTHKIKHFFKKWNLWAKFFGHRFSSALVFSVKFMAESGGFKVKGNANVSGLNFAKHLKEHIHKTVNSVGGRTAFSG